MEKDAGGKRREREEERDGERESGRGEKKMVGIRE